MKLPKRGPYRVEDVFRYLEENEDYQRMKKQRDAKIARRTEILQLEQTPLLADLKQIGWDLDTIWRFVNMPSLYDNAIPVLEKHLQLDYVDRNKEGIARALTIPAARHLWPIMVTEYEKTPGTKGTWGAKWAMGNALSVYADKTRVPELIHLALDQSGGFARTEFIRIWWRFDTPEIRDALNILVDDPFKDVADLARSVLKKIESRAERKRLKKEAKNTKEK